MPPLHVLVHLSKTGPIPVIADNNGGGWESDAGVFGYVLSASNEDTRQKVLNSFLEYFEFEHRRGEFEWVEVCPKAPLTITCQHDNSESCCRETAEQGPEAEAT